MLSKRRKGLLKKAEELSILTGANIFVLTISQAEKLYCSDSQAFDSHPCPKVNFSSEKETLAADQLEISVEIGLTTDVQEMIEELFSSDVPTLNSQFLIELNISSENIAWESLFPAFDDICREKEAIGCEEMAGKGMPFWFNRHNVQVMSCEELEQLERAILEYRQIKLSKCCYL